MASSLSLLAMTRLHENITALLPGGEFAVIGSNLLHNIRFTYIEPKERLPKSGGNLFKYCGIAMRRLDLPAMGQVLFNAYRKRDDEPAAFLGFGFHAHRAVVMFSNDEI